MQTQEFLFARTRKLENLVLVLLYAVPSVFSPYFIDLCIGRPLASCRPGSIQFLDWTEQVAKCRTLNYLQYESLINVPLGCVRHKVRRLKKPQKKFIHQLWKQHYTNTAIQQQTHCNIQTQNKTAYVISVWPWLWIGSMCDLWPWTVYTTAKSAAHMRLQIVVISFMSDARRVYG